MNTKGFLKFLEVKNQLTPAEMTTLATELGACYLSYGKMKSDLMSFLVEGDLVGFRKQLAHMEEQGRAIKANLENNIRH